MAGHSNDPASHFHDIIAYNEAVKVAIEYAKANEDTLVVCVN